MKWVKRVSIVTLVVLGVFLSVVYYMLGSEPVPESTAFEIDLLALRRLAAAEANHEPTEIRFENVANGAMPRAALMARDSFELVDMPRPVFQVLYPDGRYVLIDTAYDRAQHEQMGAPEDYFDAVWGRVVDAMEGADQIVVTHEHGDHMGGISDHPRPERIAAQLRLNAEQADAPRSVDAAVPDAIQDRVTPIDYERMTAIAPGVVLLRAAGHTPGSQMVFVRLADAREFLFVGDVVWNLDAITKLRYRPRLVTDWVLDEDRAAVLGQIRALKRLHDQGEVEFVVSHDARTIWSGKLIEGFQFPN